MPVMRLRDANCKDCYKCLRHCPVQAIAVIGQKARIVEDDCVMCGTCFLVCPQNAKEIRCDVPFVQQEIQSGKQVIATVAPSFLSDLGASCIEEVAAALRQLGFAAAYETAEGAFLVKSEYERLVRGSRGGPILSSCCPTAVALAEKRYPAALAYFAPVVSPMQASAALIRQRHPGSVVVFIGPCIAKKEELVTCPGGAQYALTFNELEDWMDERQVTIQPLEPQSRARYRSRFFPVSGGILQTMERAPGWRYFSVDGMEACMSALAEVEDGGLDHCFIELSACKGSCTGGPVSGKGRRAALDARLRVSGYAGDGDSLDFPVQAPVSLHRAFQARRLPIAPPAEDELVGVLRQIGKQSPEDELNCGACGYATCREKAQAVLRGRAELSMCLPYMKKRAESISDEIIGASPSAIVTVDESLTVRQVNPAACELFGLPASSMVGGPVSRVLDEYEFAHALRERACTPLKRAYLAEYGKYVEQRYLLADDGRMAICLMQDVTDKEKRRQELHQVKADATEITDQIVEKQMRIVHEIASLLGETAAETKIALTELKHTIALEEEEGDAT